MTLEPQRADSAVERLRESSEAPLAPVGTWSVARRASPSLQAHMIETMNERLASALELLSALKRAHPQMVGEAGQRSESLVRELYAVLDSYVDALASRITRLGGVRAPVRAALRAPGHGTQRVRATDGPGRPVALLRTLGVLGELSELGVPSVPSQLLPDARLMRGARGVIDHAATCTVVAQAVYEWLWCVEAAREDPAPAASPWPPGARRP